MAGAFPNLATLIAAKVIQGIGSAMIQGNGMATIISAFPDSQRDKALGYHLSVVASGAITGPVVGGFLISALKWRWVSFPSRSSPSPSLLFSWPPSAQGAASDTRLSFDWAGAGLFGIALLLFLLAVGAVLSFIRGERETTLASPAQPAPAAKPSRERGKTSRYNVLQKVDWLPWAGINSPHSKEINLGRWIGNLSIAVLYGRFEKTGP